MNVAFLAGHNSIRQAVMGTENRAPTPAELERMKQMVARSMGEGAFGMSTGLRYIPGYYSKTDEVVALSERTGFAVGVLHYASDTPYSRRQSLLSKSLGAFGTDSTYACAIAITRQILAHEIARLSR